MATPWKADVSHEELDSRLENAFRRVSGSIGFEISRDRCNTNLLKDSVTQALESGMDTAGPVFMRLGRGVIELGSYRPGGTVSLKEASGEILREFFSEGNAAYQVVRTNLHAEALRHMEAQGMKAEDARAALAAADESFAPPSKGAFTSEALPFIGQVIAPSGQAFLCGGATLAGLIALIRAPLPAIVAAVIVAGLVYYFARGRLRNRMQAMVQRLPRCLYDLLIRELNANISRYEAIINTALEALNNADTPKPGGRE